MKQGTCNIAFHKMLGGASLIFLIAYGISICTSSDAHAQAAERLPLIMSLPMTAVLTAALMFLQLRLIMTSPRMPDRLRRQILR
jgi:hypothetical protein